jgi:hypothetical protein
MKATSSQPVVQPEDGREAEAAKTTRLRALRLAKEAADRDAEQSAKATTSGSPSNSSPRARTLRAARAKAKSHS